MVRPTRTTRADGDSPALTCSCCGTRHSKSARPRVDSPANTWAPTRATDACKTWTLIGPSGPKPRGCAGATFLDLLSTM